MEYHGGQSNAVEHQRFLGREVFTIYLSISKLLCKAPFTDFRTYLTSLNVRLTSSQLYLLHKKEKETNSQILLKKIFFEIKSTKTDDMFNYL